MPLRNPFRGSKQPKKNSKRRFIFERDIEPLEPRRLLTTIHGGQSFEYQDINGNIDRITATGRNFTAELIGASVDRGTNAITLVDLPGELFTGNGPAVDLNGGITAPQGVQVIGTITVNDPIDANGSGNGTIGALASETSGQLWGVNVVVPQNTTQGTVQHNLLQIVQIDSRTGAGLVVAEVSTQALAAASVFSAFSGGTGPNAPPPQITGATAAAFNPVNGLLYFVATGGINNTPVLFTIDVHASDIGGSLRAIPGTFRSNGAAATNVGGMVFDRTGGGAVRLVAALNIGATTQLDTINQGNSDIWTEQVVVNTGGNPLVGLSLLGDNPNAEDTVFYGLTGQAGNGPGGNGINGNNAIAAASEVQITVFGNTSNTVDFGTLNTQTVNLVTGGTTQGTTEGNPGDLTYDPTLFDPFTGTVGALVGTDLQTHDLFIVSPINRTPTTTMFAIYVSQSDASGGLSAAVTPKPPASPIPMLPFSGSIGSVRIRNTANEVNAPQNTGSILLGAKSVQINNSQTSSDQPLLSGTLDSAHGVFPGGVGTQVEAGLVVAPGQVMGKFLWGGTIMGQVLIHGSIDQFYCGWLITGDASSGLPKYANIGIDFLVDGDIRNLYVKGPIGTDVPYGADQSSSILEFNPGGTTSSSSGPPLDNPDYLTNFTMFVGGSLGSIRAGGSIIGDIRVAHTATPTTPTWDINLLQNEMENRASPSELDSISGVGNAPFSGLSPFDDVLTGGDPIFNNDTFETAEVLGALPTVSGGPNSQVVMNGVLQAAPRQNDYADYYGVSLLGGQTVSVQLTNVALQGVSQTIGQPIDLLQVGVFDPDGRLIATDENDVLISQTLNKPFRFTADKPGLYRFAVVEFGDATFAAAASTLGDFVYTLIVGNVGDTAIGGIVTAGSMLDQGLMVDHGDLGVVEVGGTLLSDTTSNMVVAFGNMRAVEAAGIGIGFESNPGNRGSATGTYGPPTAITSIAAGANTSTVQVNAAAKNVSVTFPTGLDPNVPNGMIGELNAYGNAAANLMLINDAYSSSTGVAPPVVGGDIQLVNCAGDFWGLLYTNASIGTIRAGDMQGIDVFNEAPQIHVNVDGVGAPGIIDLIDVVGDMGDLALGGPGISTGPGGNVRYIRVGGTVYRDTFFGGRGTEENTTYGPGVSATIIDDSGALIHITPEGDVLNPNFVAGTLDPNNPAFEQFQPASLTMVTYPIEGSGGSVIINLTSSGSLTINSNGDVPGQTVEIGRVEIQGAGTSIGNSTVTTPQGTVGPLGSVKEPKSGTTTVTQPAAPTAGGTTSGTTTGSTTSTSSSGSTGNGAGTTSGSGQGGTGSIFTSPAPTTAGPGGSPGLTEATGGLPLFLHASGPANVDLFDIVVLNNGGFGDATEITNTSGGEIVNVLAQSIGRLFSTGSIGVAKQHTAAAVNPMQVIMAANNLTAANIEQYQVDPDITAGHYFGNLYPFEKQRIGVVIMGGDLLSVEAPIIGNIMVNGSIGQVIADGNTPGQGIVAPIVAFDLSQPTILNRFSLNTGPQPAGNIGSVQIGGGIAPSGSGMFAYSGIYADGRVGTISGNGADIRGNIVTAAGVDTISLHNGSIINSDIDDTTIGQQFLVTEGNLGRAGVSLVTPIDTPQVDLGTISLTGNGGIIGLEMGVDHLGSLTVNGGFGIFNSFIFNSSDGSIGTIRADGYGIRNTSILGGIVIGSITATQNGQQIPTSNYSPDVRTSETGSVDPYFGFAPNFLTDIDVYLGTNASQTTSNETQGGVIENLTVAVSRDLGSIRAFSYQQNALGTLLTTQLSDPTLFATAQGFAMALNIGNTIGTLTSTGGVNGLTVITGKIKKIQFGSDVSRLDMELAGRISNLTINGNLDDGSTIFAKGINGNIGTINVRGNLDGTIKAQKKIGTLMVGGNLTGTIDAANITKIQAGSLNTGNLTIDGNLQNLISLGDLGTTGQSILVHGSVGKVQVAGNMNTSMTVQGNMKMLKVGGSITSGTNVIVTNTLTALLVNGDVQANSTVKAHLIKIKKIKGQTLGSIITGA